MDEAGYVNEATAGGTRPQWADLIDLAGARLGGKALECSDDFFAGMDNLLKPERAIFIPGKFTTRGKWMDGWESRRKRVPGHDWCVIELGESGIIRGVCVDTAHFNGNQPESCTVEGAVLPTAAGAKSKSAPARPWRKAEWTEIIPSTKLGPSREHYIPAAEAASGHRFTHVRLNMFPDGGIARLRVFGEVVQDWAVLAKRKGKLEMSAAALGGLVVAANDMHFGSRHNLIMPGRAVNMGDGWETRRKRGLTWEDGQPREFDWAVVKLARRSLIQSIDVDTNHFKGNFPESCAIEVCDVPDGRTFSPDAAQWRSILPRTKLKASFLHLMGDRLDKQAIASPATHVRLRIFPDGGISRLRVWGRPA